jgi:uncharacterized protein DUF6634
VTIIVSRHGIDGDMLAGYVSRLETLLGHLKALQEERLPSAEEIAAAPVIDRYQGALRLAPCLIGWVGPTISRTTSELWVYAPDLGWARTFSRLYRLGRPSDAPDQVN